MTACLLWPPKRKVSFQQISKSGPVSDHTGKQNEILKLGAAGGGAGETGGTFVLVGEGRKQGLVGSSGSPIGRPQKREGPQNGDGVMGRLRRVRGARGTMAERGSPEDPPRRQAGPELPWKP